MMDATTATTDRFVSRLPYFREFPTCRKIFREIDGQRMWLACLNRHCDLCGPTIAAQSADWYCGLVIPQFEPCYAVDFFSREMAVLARRRVSRRRRKLRDRGVPEGQLPQYVCLAHFGAFDQRRYLVITNHQLPGVQQVSAEVAAAMFRDRLNHSRVVRCDASPGVRIPAFGEDESMVVVRHQVEPTEPSPLPDYQPGRAPQWFVRRVRAAIREGRLPRPQYGGLHVGALLRREKLVPLGDSFGRSGDQAIWIRNWAHWDRTDVVRLARLLGLTWRERPAPKGARLVTFSEPGTTARTELRCGRANEGSER